MSEVKIRSYEELESWLNDKPEDWAQIVAIRACLRVLPFIVFLGDGWLSGSSGLPLRSFVMSWAAKSMPGKIAEETAAFSPNFISAASAASVTADTPPRAANYATGQSNNPFEANVYSDTLWNAISGDCNWLSSKANWKSVVRIMTRRSLWLGHPPKRWKAIKLQCDSELLKSDPNYSVWIDWYERRIRGERAAFDIPGDKGRIEDKQILRRLAEATDDDFWGKGHEYVNATLNGWLDEARERVAPAILAEVSGTFDITGDAKGTVGNINPDPQDSRSPQFGSDATGRIAIKPNAGADQLRSDPQSLSRHARALQMAQRLGEALRNHNNAGYMTEIANDYVAAMDSGKDGPDPSGLVFAGDQLREAIAKHRAAGQDDDLQPLPPSADRDASAFLSAHNMYVGSDPFLDDLDRTTRGPDAPLPTANPDEIMGVVTAARQADIVAEPTYDYMAAASNAAPTVYDPTDRHSRFAAGLAQNFARYGIEFLWAYPTEAAWTSIAAGVGTSLILGPLAAAGGTVAGIALAYNLARNMAANEIVYRKLLATSPAGEDNFNRLMRFLKSLPIKSLKDD